MFRFPTQTTPFNGYRETHDPTRVSRSRSRAFTPESRRLEISSIGKAVTFALSQKASQHVWRFSRTLTRNPATAATLIIGTIGLGTCAVAEQMLMRHPHAMEHFLSN